MFIWWLLVVGSCLAWYINAANVSILRCERIRSSLCLTVLQVVLELVGQFYDESVFVVEYRVKFVQYRGRVSYRQRENFAYLRVKSTLSTMMRHTSRTFHHFLNLLKLII